MLKVAPPGNRLRIRSACGGGAIYRIVWARPHQFAHTDRANNAMGGSSREPAGGSDPWATAGLEGRPSATRWRRCVAAPVGRQQPRPERRVHSSARERDASSLQEISPLATLGRNDSHLRSNVIKSASSPAPLRRVAARPGARRSSPKSSGLASHSFRSCDGARTPTPRQVGPRRYRCAGSASAGTESDRSGCWHPKLADFGPGAGDRKIAGHPPAHSRRSR